MSDTDTLHRFLFEDVSVRGEWVQLRDSWQALRANADYPPRVRDALGEAVAAVALLAATLKFDGSLTMQLSGSGYISMLVVQATAGNTMRGMAHWDEKADIDGAELFGKDTRMVMTLDPGEGKERYQGLVELGSRGITEAVETYFQQSEQLPTRLWLYASNDVIGGLLLQAMPDQESLGDDDGWNRLVTLADTVTSDELLGLDCESLLHRLYHEESVRLFEAETLSFQCSCSASRVENMIKGMGIDEARSIIKDEGMIQVQCEFCRAQYAYDAVDVEALFAATHDAPDSRQPH